MIDNEIDLDAVRHLKVDDLKEMELPIGPSKKILHAIEQLSDQSGQALVARFPAEPVVPSGDAERRHLTIMFCDLVGSTEHATDLDPEDMYALLSSFQTTCGRIAGVHGGHVAKLLGDGILIYFGYPKAQEDDAERAVRAALAIIDAVQDITTVDQRLLQSRVGIASGVVVIGEIFSKCASFLPLRVQTRRVLQSFEVIGVGDALLSRDFSQTSSSGMYRKSALTKRPCSTNATSIA